MKLLKSIGVCGIALLLILLLVCIISYNIDQGIESVSLEIMT